MKTLLQPLDLAFLILIHHLVDPPFNNTDHLTVSTKINQWNNAYITQNNAQNH